jgi:hypothetical protein
VSFGFRTSIASFPEHATVKAVNRATDKRKKKKDEEKVRWRVKQWVNKEDSDKVWRRKREKNKWVVTVLSRPSNGMS